jgi:SPP1 family predicted phage head-tail adaptor
VPATAGAGEYDRRVTFLRRPTIESRAGNDRGNEYADVFSCWAKWREMSARERSDFGLAEDVTMGELTVRETANVATVTNADRVQFKGGSQFQVVAVSEKDRSGERKIRLERKMG